MNRSSATSPDKVILRSPADLIAAIPFLLGFHPVDSVVLVAIRDGRAIFAARGDLPGPDTGSAGQLASEMIITAAAQRPVAVVLAGYGAADAVDPLLSACRLAAAEHGLVVRDVLRVADERWWSYLCDNPDCCLPDGNPIDLSTHEVSAALTFAGLAVLPGRDAVAAQVAPVEGAARRALTAATERAGQRLGELLTGLNPSQQQAKVNSAGRVAVTAAIDRYASDGVLDDDELAWLSVLLVAIPVRDLAWQSIASTEPHLRLWGDATRRVEPSLVAAPASLLAFTAWRAGNGALAGLALERALREAPDYSMALLLADSIRQGLPPSLLDGWGTPQWRDRHLPGSIGPARRRGRRAGRSR